MILVLNSGSATLKYRLVDSVPAGAGRTGTIAHIGEPGGPADHAAALAQASAALRLDEVALAAIGHRVVHGGRRFTAPVRIDDDVVSGIRELIPLAPLHNPANLAGIEVARAHRPDVPQVAVFDTAFHSTLPEPAARYALDVALADRLGVRRYGFHGTSYRYVAGRTAELLSRPLETLNMIVLHLGNGASAAAVAGGRSVDTSMGLSPLAGLVMGTRCGDLDPAVAGHLHRTGGLGLGEVEDLLWHHSGLAGLCGDNDMRAVLRRRAAGDAAARLAFDVYCHRLRTYVGAYHAVLGRLDAVVFTAGVGEHAPDVRAAALAGLEHWGIAVDAGRNAAAATVPRVISPDHTPVRVCVVPTDEEYEIARQVAELLQLPVPAAG